MTDQPAIAEATAFDGTPDGPRVFISYSRKDRERAQGISDALAAQNFGIFRDTDDILPTEEWRDRLQELIEEADTIVFLLSPHSAVSEVCAWEVEYATSLNKRIAPIVIEDVEGADIPPLLARLNFIFCTPRDPFENAVATLVSALNTDIDWIREHTRLLALAKRWNGAGAASHLLLRGQDILDAEAWRDSHPAEAPAVTALHTRFITASRSAAMRRQRTWVAGSLIAVVLTAALAVFAWFQSVEANEQRRVAQENAAEADRQRAAAEAAAADALRERDRASQNFATAESAINALIFDIAAGLNEVEGMRLGTLTRILSRAEEAVNQMLDADPDNLGLAQKKIAMLAEFSNVYMRAGATQAALDAVDEAIALNDAAALRAKDQLTVKDNFSNLLARRAALLQLSGDTAEALKALQRSLSIAKTVADDVAEDDPKRLDYRNSVSVITGRIAHLHQMAGRPDDALAMFRETLTQGRALVAVDPGTPKRRRNLAVSLNRVAYLLDQRGEISAAKAHYDESIELTRTLLAEDPDNVLWQSDLAQSLRLIAEIHLAQGDEPTATPLLLESLAMAQRLVELDPENIETLKTLSISHERLADAYVQAGRHEDALAAYEQALATSRTLAARDRGNASLQSEVSLVLGKVADMLTLTGRPTEAIAAYEEAVATARTNAAADQERTDLRRNLAVALANLATARQGRGETNLAIPAYEEAIAVTRAEAERNPDNPTAREDLRIGLSNLGDARQSIDDAKGALPLFEEALAISRAQRAALPDAMWPADNLSYDLRRIGGAYLALNRHEAVIETYRAAVIVDRWRAERMTPNKDLRLEIANIQSILWSSYQQLGQIDEARTIAENSVEMIRTLVRENEDDIGLKRSLVQSLWGLSTVATNDRAIESMLEALRVMTPLVKQGTLPDDQAEWPRLVRERLADLYRNP